MPTLPYRLVDSRLIVMVLQHPNRLQCPPRRIHASDGKEAIVFAHVGFGRVFHHYKEVARETLCPPVQNVPFTIIFD